MGDVFGIGEAEWIAAVIAPLEVHQRRLHPYP